MRDGIRKYVNCDEPDIDPCLLGPFVEYARAELEKFERDAKKLYVECTGKTDIEFRLR